MNFRTFFLKLLTFILIFIIADQLTGKVFRYLNKHAGDKFARENYIRNTMNAELIILGSSRATYHYLPSILSDTLGMTAYNCGQRGNGIIYEYGRLATIYQRYTPKIILVDIYEEYDLAHNDNARYLDFLKPDYGENAVVDSIFHRIDPFSPIKMCLQSYRYNSTICDLILNTVLRNRGRFNSDGYAPLFGNVNPKEVKMSTSKNSCLRKDSLSVEKYKIDPIKLHYLRILAESKKENSLLIFAISPFFNKPDMKKYEIVKEICTQYNIPFLNHAIDQRFINKYELYHDVAHLNDQGAKLYTSIIAKEIKQILKSRK